MTALWTRDDAVKATGGRAQGRDWQASGVTIDSRAVAPGDLFVALAGPNHDGHDFVKGALEAGAACALVHRTPEGLAPDAALLVVDDTLAGLRALGVAARARTTARVIGVTGSVGKTGTKEMLKLVLDGQGPTHASVGSLNNHWGVPLTLARLPADAAFAVVEMGMNHSGEIRDLTRLVRPDVAVVTTVEGAHLEFFASTTEIAAAKAEIFEGMAANGIVVLNRDNRHFDQLATAARACGLTRIQGFGRDAAAEARLLDVAIEPDGTLVLALVHGQALHYRIGVAGSQWATNSLAVLLATAAAGGDAAQAARSLAALSAPKGRGQRHTFAWGGGHVALIDESYNASPASMAATLATLGATPAKRRVAVLGDMLELGEQSDALHEGLAAIVAQRGIDLVFTAGPRMARLNRALPKAKRGGHAADSAGLAPLVCAALRAGDVVMVKGSAGSRMSRVVAALLDLGAQAGKNAL